MLTKSDKKKIAAAIRANPDLTYNQIAIKTKRSPSTCRAIYSYMVETGAIESAAEKVHDPIKALQRKTRAMVTAKTHQKVLGLFTKHETLSIAQVSKKAGISFGAGYRIHDSLVLAGEIKSRRRIKTSVANKPPLFYKVNKVKAYASRHPGASVSDIARNLHMCDRTVIRYLAEK